MSDTEPADADAARDVRARVADGDVSWLRGEFRSGRLHWLQEHLEENEWEDLGRRLETGDVAWVRRVLGGVQVRGVGRLAAPAGTPTRAPRPPKPPAPPRAERPGGWLVPTGVAVTVVALLALLLAQCRGGNDGEATKTTSATTGVAATAGATADATAAAVAATTAAASTTTGAAATTAATTAAAIPTTAGSSTTAVAVTTTLAAPTLNLVDTVSSAGFTTFARALAAADLTGTLKSVGPFTVLAPSDAAFAKLPAGTLDALLKDRAALTRALRYHVLAGRVTAGQLTPGAVRTLEGGTVSVALTGGRVTVNDATVTGTDLAATNGLVHTVDTLLLPPGFTVGGKAVAVAAPPVGDVVRAASADGRFGVLLQALDAAGLTTTLQGPGPYTLFAPTDAAFRALPPELLTRLLADKATLAKVLTYHVVAGRVASAELRPGDTVTVEGDAVKVATTAAGLTIDDAGVLTADVAATNGVVHAVDRVLVPADVDLAKLGVPLTPPQPITLAVYFASDSSTIRPDAAAAIAEAAKRIPAGARIALVGVADQRGNAEANRKLSEDRAKAVQKAFEAAGLKATFTISAKGAEPSTDLQLARRVDITAT